MPNAKIRVLYQNDDLGRDYLAGVREGLGADHASMLAKVASYELSDPTVDSQIITLQGAGVDSLIIAATPKAAAQAIRKVYDLGWAPERYLATIAQSITTVLKPAGIEKSMGVSPTCGARTQRTPAGRTIRAARNGLLSCPAT
jgi:branched-chain amino acid transport system substrate-binding protein